MPARTQPVPELFARFSRDASRQPVPELFARFGRDASRQPVPEWLARLVPDASRQFGGGRVLPTELQDRAKPISRRRSRCRNLAQASR